MHHVDYRNEPYTDFLDPNERERFQAVLDRVRAGLGRHYDLIIGGRRVATDDRIVSINPANPQEVIGTVARARREHADQALEAAEEAFQRWSRTDPRARARALFRLAAILRRRKHELSATMVLEIGKQWAEADADTAEAIDFCEWYGREMIRLSEPWPLNKPAGTENETFYIPMGVGLVIPPWNFPLAILTGTTMAPVVAGNTVILKPASSTPVIAAKFMECVEEAGFPAGVINFLPGPGGEVGEYLVEHPRIRFINFTGSLEVGLRINELAAKVQPGQKWIKRVVAEMGGKDAIIVCDDANLEEAAVGIVQSAFGFQGQKCSACSRVIADARIYDDLLQKVTEKTKNLKVGPAENWENQMGALADENQFRKVLEYIEIGKSEGRLVTGGKAFPDAPARGYFIEPTIFADVDPRARIAQEEIFGPVLPFIKARDYDHALEIANDTVYGLTGSVYSRSRERLERARREFHVGNLYLNRKCTGALVGVEPFGGFNMSGTNAKAGGSDYLQLFMLAKSVSEKL
ncbi:MAG TPA: L-glutamate gamma-semialdehyde dehydrogenase [Bacillota bacterium]